MKPSGIEWIGDIPDDWEVIKTKFLFNVYGGSTPKVNVPEYWGDKITWITPGELGDDIKIVLNSKRMLSEKGLNSCGATLAPKGSIIISNRAPIGQVCLAGRELCTNQGCKSLVAKIKLSCLFFYYFFKVQSEVLNMLGNGTTFMELSASDLLNFKIPFPPLKTQQKIADYLDEKCGEIDATIAKQKESIEKLKAYKQSLISETVTKGLDKSAPLKPSGIDYLGDIPAHWEVKRIKELFSFGKGLPISKEDLIENGVPVINYGQIHSKDNNGTSIKDSLIRYVDLNYKNTNMTSLVESGDFIFADTSEDLDGCGNCIYVDSKYPIFAGYHCIILRSIKRNSSKYLAYLFQMDAWRTQIRRDVTGVKVFSISKKILGKSYILFPPRYEQECIVNYLQEKCNEIDVIINKKQNIIQKLDAYKKSLIFECVTGKQKI